VTYCGTLIEQTDFHSGSSNISFSFFLALLALYKLFPLIFLLQSIKILHTCLMCQFYIRELWPKGIRTLSRLWPSHINIKSIIDLHTHTLSHMMTAELYIYTYDVCVHVLSVWSFCPVRKQIDIKCVRSTVCHETHLSLDSTFIDMYKNLLLTFNFWILCKECMQWISRTIKIPTHLPEPLVNVCVCVRGTCREIYGETKLYIMYWKSYE